MMLVRALTNTTPSRVRNTLPLPPNTLVPPTMIAASASKSKPSDMVDTAVLEKAASTQPPSMAPSAEKAKAPITTLDVLTPARRVASRFEP